MRVCHWRVLWFALLFAAVGAALARAEEANYKLAVALDASDEHDPADRARCEARLQTLVGQLQRENLSSASSRDRAAGVTAILHREVLVGTFDPRCDSVAATLRGERFNCVTATILFCILAETCELNVMPLHAPEHVWARVDADPPLMIETTNPRWLSQTHERLAAPRAGRELSFDALCGKLVYNRGVQAIERNDFVAAKDAFAAALQLDPADAAARQNLLAALNNGAIALCRAGDCRGAIEWLDAAAVIDPSYPPLEVNRRFVLKNKS